MGRRLGLGRIRFCTRLRLGRLGGSCAHRLVRRHRSHRDALGCRWHFQLLLRLWQARPEWSGWSEWKAMRVCCGVEWGPHRGTPIVEWLLATWVADAVHGPTRSVTKPQLTMSATPCERYAATLAGQYCQLSPVSIKTNSHVSYKFSERTGVGCPAQREREREQSLSLYRPRWAEPLDCFLALVCFAMWPRVAETRSTPRTTLSRPHPACASAPQPRSPKPAPPPDIRAAYRLESYHLLPSAWSCPLFSGN